MYEQKVSFLIDDSFNFHSKKLTYSISNFLNGYFHTKINRNNSDRVLIPKLEEDL